MNGLLTTLIIIYITTITTVNISHGGDKLGGSFRKPSAMEENGPLDQIERLEKKREEHTKEK